MLVKYINSNLSSVDEPRDVCGRKRSTHIAVRLHVLRGADQFAAHLHRGIILWQLHHLHSGLADGRVKQWRILGYLAVKCAGELARHAAQRHGSAVGLVQLQI